MKSISTLSKGRPRPVPTKETAVFWEKAAEGALFLGKCTSCGRMAPPLSPRCPDCLGDQMSPIQCSGRATLAGRTVLHIPGYPGQEMPATLAQCAIEEDPRILLVALDADDVTASLAPGAPVRIGFRTDADGSYAIVMPERAL